MMTKHGTMSKKYFNDKQPNDLYHNAGQKSGFNHISEIESLFRGSFTFLIELQVALDTHTQI